MVVKAWISPMIHRHVGFEIGVNILSGVTWIAVKKKKDGIQTEVLTGFFFY
jgi:hypothetical protein